MPSAVDLHARGLAAVNAGRLRAGRTILEHAVRAAEGPTLARVRLTLSYALSDLGEPEQALALCDHVRSEETASPDLRGLAESQRALLLTHGSRHTEAAAGYDRALDLLAPENHTARGTVYLNRGTLHLQTNDPAKAAADLQRATVLLDRGGSDVKAAMARHNLGYVELLRGELVVALQQMDRARDELAPLSAVHEATCDQDRAEVLFAAGQHSEGRTALEQAAAAYGRRRLRRRQAEAELALAGRLLSTEPATAQQWARTAARRFRRHGHGVWADRASSVALIAEIERGRRTPAMLRECETLATSLRGQGLPRVARRLELATARARIARGEVGEVVTRTRLSRSMPLDLRLEERRTRAELAAARGRRADALRQLAAGLDDLTEWQSSFGSLDLQTNVVGQGTQLVALGLRLALDARDPATLLEWSERARMLASRVQPLRAPGDPALAADLAELRTAPAPERETELRARIRERAWRKAGSGEVADPVTAAGLRTRLGEHALVSYVSAGGRTVGLVVTAEGVVRRELLGSDDLDDLLGGLLPELDVAAGDLGGALGRAVRGDLTTRLERIAAALVAPVLDVVGDRPLILTPGGRLTGVPWTLLPGLVGRPVTVAQSATSWLARRGPVGRRWRTGSAGLIAGPRVARAADEVTAVAKEWDSAHTLTGETATAAAAADLAGRCDVLHVAAHGRHAAESPLFSGVQLVDGPWYGYDIDQLDAIPDIVLLSACEVGRSTVRWGEELIGMTAAWLHAGARCVIASPATVADEAAYDTLVGVHRGLASGLEPAAALAAATPTVSLDGPPAPFVCFG